MSMGTCREFARTSPKVSGRSLGEHVGRSPEEDHKTRCRECRRLPDCGSEVVSLVDFPTAEPPVSNGCTAVAQDFERLSAAKPPRLGG
ncbi:hypothetical protein BHM03_00045115 [Ensete ventricosum]|nr:hypothetical protein BHM03_00045115 [Ensete ventricosum]